MPVFALKYLLGLVFVGIIWTAKGDMRPNGNDFSDSKTVLLRHQRDAKVQRAVSTKRAAKPAGKPASHTVKAGPLILGNANRKKWLDEHNKIRAGTNTWMGLKQGVASGMMRMYWNAYLEASALAWSWEMCKEYKHGQNDLVVKSKVFKQKMSKKYGDFIGQNIEWHTGPRREPHEIMKDYGGEKVDMIWNGPKYKCTAGKGCGHYTAITWNTTWLVGCGHSWCDNQYGFTSACNFLPGGNSGDNPPYKMGPACSTCNHFKETFSECENHLCQPKDPCSAIHECTVIDKETCLCSDKEYKEIIEPYLALGRASPAVSLTCFSRLSLILLSLGVQLVFDSGLL